MKKHQVRNDEGLSICKTALNARKGRIVNCCLQLSSLSVAKDLTLIKQGGEVKPFSETAHPVAKKQLTYYPLHSIFSLDFLFLCYQEQRMSHSAAASRIFIPKFRVLRIASMRRILLLTAITILTFQHVSAQTKQENSGWFFLLNSTKLSEKWGLHLDVQVRSGDSWEGTKNVLFRPGITYFIDKKQNITAGYLLASTQAVPSTLFEHRIWEQYIISHKISSVFAAHRFRLEQRFLANDNFAQRFRYFIRLIQPLQKTEQAFTKGAFFALQNEVFLNIQNKEFVNNSLFDQNRLYIAAGYRFSKKIDIEAGYLNQAINGKSSNTVNNVSQLALYTRF